MLRAWVNILFQAEACQKKLSDWYIAVFDSVRLKAFVSFWAISDIVEVDLRE